jgi:hypothetical protein
MELVREEPVHQRQVLDTGVRALAVERGDGPGAAAAAWTGAGSRSPLAAVGDVHLAVAVLERQVQEVCEAGREFARGAVGRGGDVDDRDALVAGVALPDTQFVRAAELLDRRGPARCPGGWRRSGRAGR